MVNDTFLKPIKAKGSKKRENALYSFANTQWPCFYYEKESQKENK